MKIFIYKLMDPRTGEAKYVGKTNKPAVRLKRHRSVRCNYSTRHWREELLSLGLSPKLEVLEEIDDGRWHEREQYWIEILRSRGNDLLNIATWPCPGPLLNHEVSVTTRAKLRSAFTGRKLTEAQRLQISSSLTGKKQSPETIAKRRETILRKYGTLGCFGETHKRAVSDGLKGRTISTETRTKLREANIGKKQSASTIAKRITPEFREKARTARNKWLLTHGYWVTPTFTEVSVA